MSVQDPETTADERRQIITLEARGWSDREIAGETGLPADFIKKLLKPFKDGCRLKRRPE